jgi:hypothetical protein
MYTVRRRRLAAFDLPRTFASGRGVVEAAMAKRRRVVIQGDKRHMHKGIHYSVVYCPSSSLDASRVLQAYATGEKKHVFAGDVATAFLQGSGAGDRPCACDYCGRAHRAAAGGAAVRAAYLDVIHIAIV